LATLNAKTTPRAKTATGDDAASWDARPERSTPVRATRPAGPADPGRRKVRKREKDKQEKVIRDSFTMPVTDYALIAELKQHWLSAGMEVKKSQLLRAGLHALSRLSKSAQKRILTELEPVKTGRPARKRPA
jgi:hypothetical protein